MRPAAFGYLSLRPERRANDLHDQAATGSDQLAHFADREGYALAGVFTDVRGQTESGPYQLLARLRSGDAVAVVVPDLDHLCHAGCLTGADLRTASRYLRARLITIAPEAGGNVPVARSEPPVDDRYARAARRSRAPR